MLTDVVEKRVHRGLTVLCETKRNGAKRNGTKRNENLLFAKWKSVVCEMKIKEAYNKSKSWLLPWQPHSIPSKRKLDYPSSFANWWGKDFLFLPFCEWLSLRKVVLNSFWNCWNHLVAVVYFHYPLLLNCRTVFVEIKLPILLYYWINYFFIRGDEKFSFFRPVKAIVRTVFFLFEFLIKKEEILLTVFLLF